jgi:tetratricopeptide (TPR) repeat protein
MDLNNPVIKYCVEGMQAEAEGRFADAHNLFNQAWTARQDDFDACVAAHYMARHQKTPEERLCWNQKALQYTDAVGDDRVEAFYSSLYLNLGKSYEDLGDPATARHYYEQAHTKANLLSGAYVDIVRRGIAAGLKRTDAGTECK